MMLVQIDVFPSISSTWEPFWFFPAMLMSFTYTDKNNFCLQWTNKHSQFGTFSHLSSNATSSNCLSHMSPARRCAYKFLARGTTGSSMFSQDFEHLCRGRRIHMSGHSDFGIMSHLGASSIFTWYSSNDIHYICGRHLKRKMRIVQ